MRAVFNIQLKEKQRKKEGKLMNKHANRMFTTIYKKKRSATKNKQTKNNRTANS